MELNPDALAWARHADRLRRQGTVLGPLHGIPVLLKGNIDTGDRMQTTAGSFGLKGAPATQDSTVAAHLRAGGAVILGKTNLSEWANFRSFFSTSGWSAVGGQTNNPYGINRNPCGSSAGSGAAATANFAAVSLGTETDGSIVCPGNANGVVGLKPTVGLTSRAGVVPISHTQDTVGPHARSVADAAITLSVIRAAPPTDVTRPPAAYRSAGKAARADEHSDGLHAVSQSRRIARRASRRHAPGNRQRARPGGGSLRRNARRHEGRGRDLDRSRRRRLRVRAGRRRVPRAVLRVQE
jgi:amidase